MRIICLSILHLTFWNMIIASSLTSITGSACIGWTTVSTSNDCKSNCLWNHSWSWSHTGCFDPPQISSSILLAAIYVSYSLGAWLLTCLQCISKKNHWRFAHWANPSLSGLTFHMRSKSIFNFAFPENCEARADEACASPVPQVVKVHPPPHLFPLNHLQTTLFCSKSNFHSILFLQGGWDDLARPCWLLPHHIRIWSQVCH